MTTRTIIVTYLCIGCIKGIVEFAIAQRAFRKHPYAAAVSGRNTLARCIIKNAVAWPVLILLLALFGAFKVFLHFRRPGGWKGE